ncbi:MAG: hypothetical protein J5669_00470 [Bacteroidales bacterium]|nr:hypothetical protein [Bacteroidales bacterium]
MKKSILFASLVLLLLASCARNETRETTIGRDAVSFNAYSGRVISKAGPTADMKQSKLEELGFGVFATYSGTNNFSKASNNYMYNQQVTKPANAAKWEYSPLKYWPNPTDGSDANDQKVSFFAYGPYADPEATSADNTYGIIGFGIDATTGHNLVSYAFASGKPNVDLLWGYKSGSNPSVAQLNCTRETDIIKLNFRHLLSKLGGSQDGDPADVGPNGVIIKANPSEAPTNGFATANGTKITVQKIIIESALVDENGDPIVYAADDAIQTGKLDLYTGDFVLDAAPQNIKFRQEISADAADIAAGASELAESLKEVANPASFAAVNPGVTTSAVNVYKSEVTPLILIPGTTPVVDVTIKYYVRTYDAKLQGKPYTEVPQTVFGKVAFPVIEAAKKYNLRIILGLSGATFEAAVDDWDVELIDRNGDGIIDDNDDVTVDLPSNS